MKLRVDCPGCDAPIDLEFNIKITNYQPSGPPGTPRATMVTARAPTAHHSCDTVYTSAPEPVNFR